MAIAVSIILFPAYNHKNLNFVRGWELELSIVFALTCSHFSHLTLKWQWKYNVATLNLLIVWPRKYLKA